MGACLATGLMGLRLVVRGLVNGRLVVGSRMVGERGCIVSGEVLRGATEQVALDRCRECSEPRWCGTSSEFRSDLLVDGGGAAGKSFRDKGWWKRGCKDFEDGQRVESAGRCHRRRRRSNSRKGGQSKSLELHCF